MVLRPRVEGGQPSRHLRAVACGSDFAAHGGHLVALDVGTGSMEITVVVHELALERAVDERTGANVVQRLRCAHREAGAIDARPGSERSQPRR